MNSGMELRNWGMTLLRAVVGVVFVMHGWQKLGMGFHQVAEYLETASIPYPETAAVVLTVAELFGGMALILGVLTRYVAVALAFDMSVAIITVHAKNGFFMPNGIEFPMVLLVANLCLIMGGGGVFELFRF